MSVRVKTRGKHFRQHLTLQMTSSLTMLLLSNKTQEELLKFINPQEILNKNFSLCLKTRTQTKNLRFHLLNQMLLTSSKISILELSTNLHLKHNQFKNNQACLQLPQCWEVNSNQISSSRSNSQRVHSSLHLSCRANQ